MSKVKVSCHPALNVGQRSRAFLSRNREDFCLLPCLNQESDKVCAARGGNLPWHRPCPVTVTSVTHTLCHGLDRPLGPVPFLLIEEKAHVWGSPAIGYVGKPDAQLALLCEANKSGLFVVQCLSTVFFK